MFKQTIKYKLLKKLIKKKTIMNALSYIIYEFDELNIIEG